MADYRIEFERLGRTHNPPALEFTYDLPDDALMDAFVVEIDRHARRFCGSRDLSVVIDSDGSGFVMAGVRNAGNFRILESVAKEADSG